MKILKISILFFLFCSCCHAQYDTLKQNYYEVADTAGIHYVSYRGAIDYYFNADDGYGSHGIIDAYPGNSVVSFESINQKNELAATGIGLNLLALYDVTNYLGTNFFIGQYAAKFYDYRPIKRGIEYNNTGYVKQIHSLTDKEYVDKHQLTSKTKTTLPSASPAGQMIYVSNATGGPVPAYSDGTNWRRFSDNSIIN